MTGRVQVHMAVPEAKRALAATMSGLSGNPLEHSIRCTATPSGAAASWDATQGYDGTWWAASQAFDPVIAQEMMEDGYELETESVFAAFFEDDGTLIDHNLPDPPEDASFDAFLSAAGLAKVVQGV